MCTIGGGGHIRMYSTLGGSNIFSNRGWLIYEQQRMDDALTEMESRPAPGKFPGSSVAHFLRKSRT